MKYFWLFLSLLVSALLISSGSAVYYRTKALDYETRWSEAMRQLETALRTPKQFRAVKKPIDSAVAVPEHPEDLNGEILTLRAELEEKNALIGRLTARTNSTVSVFGFASTAEKQSLLEEMKKTDPEKYTELMARREESRQNIQNAFAQKAVTLLNRDTSNLDKEQLAQYKTMLNLMNETWQLTEKITAPETPREERQEIRQLLTEKTKELRPLLQNERDSRFIELGLASGYTAEEAESFAKYIDDTIQATTIPGGGSRGGRRPEPSRPQ